MQVLLKGSVLSVLLFFANPVFTQELNIAGLWFAEKFEESLIQLNQTEKGMWEGKIVKSANSKFKNRIIFKDGKYNSTDNNIKGTLIKPDTDLEITTTISLEKDKKLKLVGRKLWMKKTFYWSKKTG